MKMLSITNSSGYPTGIFVSAPSDALKCPLCLEILKDPRQCPRGHCFCNSCISTSLCSAKRCPVCRCKLHIDSLSVNLLAHNTVQDLRVYCNPRSYGGDTTSDSCSWIGPLCQLNNHISNECLYAEVLCPTKGCEAIIQRRQLSAHQEVCPHRIVSCIYCSYSFKLKHITSHLNHCHKKPVSCPNQCGETCSSDEVDNHLSQCSMTLIPCPLVELSGHCSNCSGIILRKNAKQHVCSPDQLQSTVFGLLMKQKEMQEELECTNNYLMLDNTLLRLNQHLLRKQLCCHRLLMESRYSSETLTTLHSLVRALHPMKDRALIGALTQQLKRHLEEIEVGVDTVSLAAVFSSRGTSCLIRRALVSVNGQSLTLTVGLRRRNNNRSLTTFVRCRGGGSGEVMHYSLTSVLMGTMAWHSTEGVYSNSEDDHSAQQRVSHLVDNQSPDSVRHRVCVNANNAEADTLIKMLVFVTLTLPRDQIQAQEDSENSICSVDEMDDQESCGLFVFGPG